MAKDLPPEANALPSIEAFKQSSAVMFDAFSRYSDLVDIRLSQFTPRLTQFSPKELFNDLKQQNKEMNENINFEFEGFIPKKVIGEFFRLNYLIVKLLQNSFEREAYYVKIGKKIEVKFSFEDSLLLDSNSLLVKISDSGPLLNRH